MTKKNFNFGTWVQLGSQNVFNILSSYKFDFYVIDLEHGSHESIETFPFLKRSDSKLYIRVSTRNTADYKWLLDIGYDGIILSDVRNVDDVKFIVNSAYFPPIGNRGVGFCAKNSFGKNINNYIENNNSPFIGIQVESVEGIDNLEKILNLYREQINACFLGPYDLSCDLGVTGDFTNDRFQFQKERYLKVLQNYTSIGKGIHVVSNNFNEVLECSKLGYNFIAFSTDGLLLQNTLNQISII
jgi:2-keto-3-deoxy-L-rhamnonate aldolase RhmA